MKLVCIFVSEDSADGLWSIQLDGEKQIKPLNDFEYAITTHQKSKVRILKGWLRVYAIRLAQNCYLITGGAIKLTQNMERKHLQKELKKLDQARMFLRNNEIDYPEDLNTYQNE